MRAALSGHRERAVDEAMGEATGDPSARLYVEELKLTNFRNYERAGVSLDERPVVLVGDNGAGKTNLLEAVSLLGPGQGLRGRDYGELARKDGPGGWAVAATVMSLEGVVEIGTGFGLAGGSEGIRPQRAHRRQGSERGRACPLRAARLGDPGDGWAVHRVPPPSAAASSTG